MTDYYRLFMELEIPGKWYLSDILGPNRKEVMPSTFNAGFPVDPIPGLTVIPNVTGNPIDFTLTTFQVPIVSSAFAEVVEAMDAEAIQRIPVTIFPSFTGFEILNVIRTVACLDYEKSRFTIYGEFHPVEKQGKISAIVDLRILPEKAEGYHIFRLAEWILAIIVSETLKNALEKEGFIGMKFYPA